MQKKLIVLALAAVISTPVLADTSNVVIYGVADVSYDVINTGNSVTPVASGIRSKRISSNASRLGFKGAEDLGGGLSAIWQVETLINIGNGTAAGTGIGGRNTYVGLSDSNKGAIVMGRLDTPYKNSTRKLDVFADGIADNRSIMGGNSTLATVGGLPANATAAASFDGRQDQVIAYISPKFADMFTGSIGYVNLTPTASTAAAATSSAWSMAVAADIAGGFSGSLAYEVHDFTAAAPGVKTNEKATKLGLGYTQDAFAVGFAYEHTRDNFSTTAANLYGHNAYYLSGKYNIGSDAVKVAYTKASDTSVASTGAHQFSVGYDHNMSKRTTLYALYTKLSNKSAAGYTLSNEASIGGTNTSAGLGASPSAFAFGMKHTF